MLKVQAKCSVYPRVVAVNRPHIPWQRLKREKVISPGCIVYLSPAPGFPPLFFALKNAIPPFFLKAQRSTFAKLLRLVHISEQCSPSSPLPPCPSTLAAPP